MAVNEIIGVLSDRGILRQLGREIADGMNTGRTFYGPENPSGRTSGVAGGRGSDLQERKEAKDAIRAKQLETKFANQVTNSFKNMNKELSKSEQSLGKARQQTAAFSKVFGEQWNNAMNQVAESKRSEQKLISNLNNKLAENIESLDDVLRIRQRQQRLEEEILDTKTVTNRATVEEYNRLSSALGEASLNVESFRDDIENTTKRAIRAFFSVEAAAANLSIAMTQLMNDFRAQLRFGSEMGVAANQIQAMVMGMDPGVFTEINAQARQASLTFGSLEEYTSTLRDQQLRYFNQIGDLTESTRFTAETFQLLGRSGVRPTVEAMDSMAGSFRVLNKIAGVTSDQFNGMMEGLLADEDISAKLRAAKADERQAIIAGIARQVEMNTAMGMTVEQSLEAARSLGRLSGGTARERFRQAAMAQATMGAMGISGGAEAADLIRKGQRRTADENARLQELMGQVSNAASEAQRGGYGAEMMVDTMMDRSQMGQYLGPNSPFNTRLTEGLAANKSVLEEIRDSIREDLSIGERALVIADTVGNFVMNGALGKLFIGAAQLIGAYILGRGALGALGRGGGLAGAATAARGAAGQVANVARGAAAPAAAAAAAGYGVYQAGQAITTGRSDVHDALVSTSIGQSISDGIGSGIAHTLAFFGNDAAQEAIRLQDEARMAQEKSAVAAESIVTPTTETAEATRHSAATLDQLLEVSRANLELQTGAIDRQAAQARLSMMATNTQSSRLLN